MEGTDEAIDSRWETSEFAIAAVHNKARREAEAGAKVELGELGLFIVSFCSQDIAGSS